MNTPFVPSLQPLSGIQAQFAQAAQAAIETGRQWSAQQSSAGLNLLHAQLDLYNGGAGGASLRQYFALQTKFFDDLASQQKEVLQQVEARAQAYTSDLRQTVSSDEVSLVTVGFFKDVGKVLQDSAEQAATLLSSTSAAATVLTDKALAETAKGD